MTDQVADHELAAFLADFNARGVPPAAQAGAAAMRAAAAQRAAAKPAGPAMSVSHLQVPGAGPARLYRPGGGVPAVLLFLHGGGFVIGDLDTHDRATWPGCPRPSSSPASTTRCGTRARRTPGAWRRPASR
jgi:acetyl esterase/lipase